MNLTPYRNSPVSGSVLVLALWTLFFLSALALAVAAYVGGGIGLASAMKSDRAGYFAARAGVETAVSIVVSDTNSWDAFTEDWSNNEELFRDVALEQGRDGSVDAGRFTLVRSHEPGRGKSKTRYGLADEESRIDLNKAKRPVLLALLQRVGLVDPLKAARIADAIIDWRDVDDERLTGGAENAYYQALPTAYECGNGPMNSVEELLLVREVTPELFTRLFPYVTVYGSGGININTAGSTVLAVLGDAVTGEKNPVGESLATRIQAFRDKGNVFERADQAGIVRRLQKAGGAADKELGLLTSMLRYLTVGSTCFRGVVIGRPGTTNEGGPGGERTIEFVFDRKARKTLMWRED